MNRTAGSRTSVPTFRRAAVRAGPLVIVGVLAASSAQTVAQEGEPRVTVAGEVLATGNYVWHVRNLSDSPIVEIVIPHYHGDLFMTPPGWKQKCTYLVNVGVEDRPGECRAYVSDPRDGIRRSAAETFELRIARAGAREGRDVVRVRFADGSEAQVAGVPVPVAPHFTEYLVAPVGLAVLLAAAVLFEIRRRRKRRDERKDEGSGVGRG